MVDDTSRFRRVSRRAVLKSSLGAGFAAATAAACGNQDADVFAGSVAEPVETTTTTTTTTAPATTQPAAETPTTETPTTTTEPQPLPEGAVVAVAGEMVINFTYTQGAGGLNENPYVAVWIEDAAGDLLTTLAVYYEQSRRGRRWIDHLDRWFTGDAARVAAGGADTSAIISTSTRPPGTYSVAWDGSVDGGFAPAGNYWVCIESAREPGAAYSLIREPFQLVGSLAQTSLPDTGELSQASVMINV